MLERHKLFAIAVGFILMPGVAAAQSAAPVTSTAVPVVGGTASEQMLTQGPEAQALAARAGLWDMTQTSWSSPNAAPVTITGLVAERQMIGPFLEEVVHPGSDGSAAPFKRLDYLTFNRVEGRWDYASMDTRSSNGIMPAWSVGRDRADRIDLVFQPFAIVGGGSEVKGQMLRMEQIITQDGPDRDVKDQYFILADGVGTKWLAKRYAYTRRPP
jgi:hypothetical protein